MDDETALARQPARIGHQLRPSRVAAMAAAQSTEAAMERVFAISAQVLRLHPAWLASPEFEHMCVCARARFDRFPVP